MVVGINVPVDRDSGMGQCLETVSWASGLDDLRLNHLQSESQSAKDNRLIIFIFPNTPSS